MIDDSDPPAITYDECYTDLRSCREQFESIRRDVEELVSAVSPRQLIWRPRGGDWSILQCIAHLNGVTVATTARLREIESLLRSSGLHLRGPWHSAEGAPLLLSTTNGVAEPANKTAATPIISDEDRVVDTFRELNEQILGLIGLAEGIGTSGGSPVASEALLAELGHTLQLTAMQHWRYILQARRITERPNFPRD